MIFHTFSGSVYEVDTNLNRIRRVSGKTPASEHRPQEHGWRNYADLYPNPIAEGNSVLIFWNDDLKDPQTTRTSYVVKVEP